MKSKVALLEFRTELSNDECKELLTRILSGVVELAQAPHVQEVQSATEES